MANPGPTPNTAQQVSGASGDNAEVDEMQDVLAADKKKPATDDIKRKVSEHSMKAHREGFLARYGNEDFHYMHEGMPEMAKDFFAMIDASGDGRICGVELEKAAEMVKSFTDHVNNNKGELEYKFFSKSVKEALQVWDTDGSGTVSVSELIDAAHAQQRMKSETRLLKRMLVGALLVILILCGATFALSLGAAELSKETKDGGGVMVSASSGAPMATAGVKAGMTLLDLALPTTSDKVLASIDQLTLEATGGEKFGVSVQGYRRFKLGEVVLNTADGARIFVSATKAYIVSDGQQFVLKTHDAKGRRLSGDNNMATYAPQQEMDDHMKCDQPEFKDMPACSGGDYNPPPMHNYMNPLRLGGDNMRCKGTPPHGWGNLGETDPATCIDNCLKKDTCQFAVWRLETKKCTEVANCAATIWDKGGPWKVWAKMQDSQPHNPPTDGNQGGNPDQGSPDQGSNGDMGSPDQGSHGDQGNNGDMGSPGDNRNGDGDDGRGAAMCAGECPFECRECKKDCESGTAKAGGCIDCTERCRPCMKCHDMVHGYNKNDPTNSGPPPGQWVEPSFPCDDVCDPSCKKCEDKCDEGPGDECKTCMNANQCGDCLECFMKNGGPNDGPHDGPGDHNDGTHTGDNSGTNTGDNTGTGDNTADNTGDNSGTNTGDNTADNTGDNTGTNTGDNTGDPNGGHDGSKNDGHGNDGGNQGGHPCQSVCPRAQCEKPCGADCSEDHLSSKCLNCVAANRCEACYECHMSLHMNNGGGNGDGNMNNGNGGHDGNDGNMNNGDGNMNDGSQR